MNDELKNLLRKYKDGDLDGEERRRLAELVCSDDGHLQALKSGCPEAIFLALEETALPEWENYRSRLESRLGGRGQRQPAGFGWKPALAAAAMIVLAALFIMPFLPGPPAGEPEAPAALPFEKRTFSLRHRLPSEVLTELRQFMSDDAELHVRQEKRELEITDRPENLERISRALAMLDRPAAVLRLRLQLLYAVGGGSEDAQAAGVRREVGGLEKTDLSGYRLKGEIVLTPEAGRRYSATLQDRYVINCLADLKPDGTGVVLRDISIYDQRTQKIVRKSSLSFAEGERLVIQTELKDDSGRPLVVAVGIDLDGRE